MLWCDVVAILDKLRTHIRATRNLKAVADKEEMMQLLAEYQSAITRRLHVDEDPRPLPPPAPIEPAPDMSALVWLEEPELKEPAAPVRTRIDTAQMGVVKEKFASAAADGATVTVMERDVPFVPKKPVLEEVTEEELGK